MADLLVDTSCAVSCPHGGTGAFEGSSAKTAMAGHGAVRATDSITISGCTHTDSDGNQSPCVTVDWPAATTRVTVDGSAARLVSGSPQCLNAAGASQGAAQILAGQGKVRGQ